MQERKAIASYKLQTHVEVLQSTSANTHSSYDMYFAIGSSFLIHAHWYTLAIMIIFLCLIEPFSS